jgi:hypothetical protein
MIVALLIVFAVMSNAVGYWTQAGFGVASEAAAGLAAPGNVAGSSNGTAVHVSWTVVSAPGAGAFGYYVQRYSSADGYSNASTPSGTCNSSLHALLAPTASSCDDSSTPPGSYKYRVVSVFRSWTTGSSLSATVPVMTVDHFVVSTTVSTTAGVPLTVTVVAKDASNATIINYVGTVSFTSTDPAATLPANYQFAPSDFGSHSFANAIALKTAGSQIISVADTSITKAVGSTNVSVGAATLDHFEIIAPVTVTAGLAFTTAAVAAKDGYGNPALGWTSIAQCVTFSGPANAPDGTVPTYPARLSCPSGQSLLSFNSAGASTGFSITLVDAQTTALTVTSAIANGTSTNFAVKADAAAGIRIANGSNRNGLVNITCTGAISALICAPSASNGPGNGRFFTASVVLVDAHQNASANLSGGAIAVSVTQSGANSVSPVSLSIQSADTTSSAFFMLTLPNGSSAGTAIVSANVGASSVSARLTTS